MERPERYKINIIKEVFLVRVTMGKLVQQEER
jgi:hypothetical protein